METGDTPAWRLEQTAAGGFTAQTWDVAGNEANFFVRDVTATNAVGTGPPSIAASISVPVLTVPAVTGWPLALLGLLVSLIGVLYRRRRV